ncbi:endo-1,4-beta-xylanase [Tsukamurella strandjordii]|uniref:endo-1,4-beta-xylanase n=1 Tax=Tsukamurella strandjordii TaxID=147577 RepID=A0AA90NF63_9ACTN|nr:endo-1,4-beta-xylanase [Tsukamurella strandjordii]MDP0397271.1 endo-1,4-beta-xylanase [Tsukamurella strandjordii]
MSVRVAPIVVALASAGLLSAACTVPAPPSSPDSPAPAAPTCGPDTAGFRGAAERSGIDVGTAYRSTFTDGDPCYESVAGTAFTSLTTEIGTMTNTVAPEAGRFDFREADAVAETARRHGQRFDIHSLVWDPLDQQVWGIVPPYVQRMTDEGRRTFLRELVTTVVRRYADRANTVTVVNEPFDQRGELQRNAWWRTTGDDRYIAEAFRAARKAAPRAKLYLNEHSSETVSDKSTALLALATKLRAMTEDVEIDGVRVTKPLLDGVGFQAHMLGGADQQPRVADMRANFQRFADAGLDVRLTELDVRIPTDKGAAAPEDLRRQGRMYATMTGLCRELSACTGVTVWGFTDKRSWITDYPDTFSGYGSANLLDREYQSRPAWNEFIGALR